MGKNNLLTECIDECLEELNDASSIKFAFPRRDNFADIDKNIDLLEKLGCSSGLTIYDYKEKLDFLDGLRELPCR